MEHSEYFPYTELFKEKLSIARIAELVLSFYKRLAIENSDFNKLYLVSERPSLYDSIDIQKSDAQKILADEILNQNIEDIRKQDKVENPGIDYSRDASVLFSLEAKTGKETLIILNFSFGTKIKSSIGAIAINKYCFDSYDKAKFFLDAEVAVFNVIYSILKIRERDFTRKTRAFKVPLGWITYFSDDSEWGIPDDLGGIEYEHVDEGKYLILSREDITSDSEKLEAGKQKLLEVMEEIKRRVPEYGK